MAEFKQQLLGGVNLDADQTRISETQAIFIKNMSINAGVNPDADAKAGANEGVYTPLEGNTQLPITLPSGFNYCIGGYSSDQTNEYYFGIYNSNSNHTIWVINGDDGTIRKVIQSSLLPFLLDPEFFLSEGRMTLEMRSYVDKVTLKETNFKFLIFANNYKNQFCISVEDSIATNGFTTPFFTSSAAFYEQIELIHLGVPTPLKCIGLNTPNKYVPVAADQQLQNAIINNGWQVRIKNIDFFGRESEHGLISDQFMTLAGVGCITSSSGLARCFNLNFDAGNPLVNQIQIEFRQWISGVAGTGIPGDWKIYEIINKYDNGSGQWYTRGMNPLFTTVGSGMTFDATTNKITYAFCGDKNSIPIDPEETSRTEPELPRISNGVFSMNKRIGLLNNVRGFEPIAPDLINKINFSAVIPGAGGCSAAPLRTITVYAVIYDPVAVLVGEHKQGFLRTSHGKVGFGRSSNNCGSYGFYAVDQVFADQTHPGFIGVLRGTPHKCISRQGDFDPATGVFVPVGYTSFTFAHGPIQEFTFTDVPAGKYIMQIASHKSTINDADIQRTSTYVAGISNISDLVGPTALNSFASNPTKEIEIDCSAGNILLNGYQPGQLPSTTPLFTILDMVINSRFGNGSAVVDGYLYEQNGGDTPVEMTPVYLRARAGTGTLTDAFGSFFTDHNGFYFGASDAYDIDVLFFADICDGMGVKNRGIYGPSDTFHPYIHQASGGITHGDGSGTGSGCTGVHGNWKNRIYLFPTAGTYPDAARRRVKIKATLCTDHTIGVPGIPVIMTKIATASLTDTDGLATFVAHNRYNYLTAIATVPLPAPWLSSSVPDYSGSPNNQEKLILSQKGGCEWNACGGCDTFMSDVVVAYLACGVAASGCTGSQPLRTLCVADVHATPSGIDIGGVQSGGKYPIGFILYDEIGRHTAVQIKQGNAGFVDIPNVNDIGYRQFALCSLQAVISAGFSVDPVFKKIGFAVGPNVRFSDFFSWPADWVQHVDNTGATNTVNPTFTRIYYGSLREYNKQNNFSSTSIWQFLSTGQGSSGNTPAHMGDVVQFIMDGDGTWLDSVISAPITYDKNGQFFTIEYIPALATLKNGSLFRVIRPTINNSNEFTPYFEQCCVYDLVNGVLPPQTIKLPYFDSYFLSRLVPTPIMAAIITPAVGTTPAVIGDQGGGVTPGGIPPFPLVYTNTNNNALIKNYADTNDNSNGVVVFSVNDFAAAFPFLFESPSASDFWGNHISNRGRIMFSNAVEAQQRSGTEVALSDSLLDRGVLNGLSYFESKNVQTFDRNTWGDIIAVLVEVGRLLFICERDHFTSSYNGQQVRTDKSGNMLVDNAYGVFTAPNRPPGTAYGCGMFEINTIRKYAGRVAWVDSSGYMVFHDFNAARAVEEAGYSAYLANKIATIKTLNLNPGVNGKTFLHGGIDPKTYEYYLTSFNLPVTGSPTYGNALDVVNLLVNETLCIDLDKGILKNLPPFTAEAYGNICTFYLQRNFISFKNGQPYIHHHGPGAIPPYGKFFGVQYKKIIRLVVNQLPNTVKRFMYNEVYCKQHKFIVTSIKTESGQLSRLLAIMWDFRNKYWAADYKCDLNTVFDPSLPPVVIANPLYEGDTLYGRWAEVTYESEDADDPKYCELSSIVNYYIEESNGAR